MKRNRLGNLVLAAALALGAGHAYAWGNDGHETIGAIADTLLAGTPTERKLRRILLPGETLETISVWADCAKAYCGPLTPEMHAFVRANRDHHEYHYTDVPIQLDRYAPGAVGTTDHDVVRILRRAILVLQRKDTPQTNPTALSRRQAVLLIAHLVGDVHQPLHVGSAYIDAGNRFVLPASDAAIDGASIFSTTGGNDLMLDSRSLHAYWDTAVVDALMRRADAGTPKELAAALLAKWTPPARIGGASVNWPEKWATETLKVSAKIHEGLQPAGQFFRNRPSVTVFPPA